MNFVYPYIEAPSWYYKAGTFYELDHSIRSVRRFFPRARIIVVGDDPRLDVEHIPVDRIYVSSIEVRHRDIIEKLSAVVDEVDDFVLMYDDIFYLDVKKRDLKRQYALAKIDDLSTYNRGKGGLLYTRLWQKTYKKCAEMTDALYDWETHLPRYLESDKVKWLINTFDLKHNDYIITSLYATLYWDSPVLLSEHDDIRSHVDIMGPGVDLDKEFSRKFLVIDDNACTPTMIDRIRRL
jgi:hypothetical protein